MVSMLLRVICMCDLLRSSACVWFSGIAVGKGSVPAEFDT